MVHTFPESGRKICGVLIHKSRMNAVLSVIHLDVIVLELQSLNAPRLQKAKRLSGIQNSHKRVSSAGEGYVRFA
jgi:hypothetical protein